MKIDENNVFKMSSTKSIYDFLLDKEKEVIDKYN